MGFASTWRLGLGIAALLTAAGCSTAQYIYRPEENATARLSGRPAAYYQIPTESPHGSVRVAAIGIAELERRGTDRRIHAMHVRLVVDNNDDSAPWQVDTREQRASLDGYGQSCPAFAKARPGEAPIVTIAPGTSSAIDLYYPLPRSMQNAAEVPEFGVLWRVQTPESLVAERTSFERLRIEPSSPPPGYYGVDGWGPGIYGWYDPFWPDTAFWGAPIVYSSRPPAVMAVPAARRVR